MVLVRLPFKFPNIRIADFNAGYYEPSLIRYSAYSKQLRDCPTQATIHSFKTS